MSKRREEDPYATAWCIIFCGLVSGEELVGEVDKLIMCRLQGATESRIEILAAFQKTVESYG